MSDRAIAFLNNFTNDRLNALPYPEHDGYAQRLAKECIAEASKLGITEEELVEDLGQDLVSELHNRLEDRADDPIAQSAAKDN